MYPRPDGSVYICGSPEYIALPNDPRTIQANPESIEDLKEVACSVSSKLADAPLEVGQSCFLPISPDGLPVMGKIPGVQGAYIASGSPLGPSACFFHLPGKLDCFSLHMSIPATLSVMLLLPCGCL